MLVSLLLKDLPSKRPEFVTFVGTKKNLIVRNFHSFKGWKNICYLCWPRVNIVRSAGLINLCKKWLDLSNTLVKFLSVIEKLSLHKRLHLLIGCNVSCFCLNITSYPKMDWFENVSLFEWVLYVCSYILFAYV